MSSTPDELAAATRELALAALHEITPASTVGPYADHRVEAEGVVSLRFQNRLPGYPGWFWTVTVAQVDDTEPTVLEAELMPGDGALLAPDWVPWAERLAEYRAHQAELAEAAAEAEGAEDASDEDDAESAGDAEESDDDDAEADDDAEDDDEDDDADAALSDLLHAGDLDGVDIDELDPAAGDADSDDDSEDDNDESDEEDDDSEDESDEDDDSEDDEDESEDDEDDESDEDDDEE